MIKSGKGNLLDFIKAQLGEQTTGEYIRLSGNDPDFEKKAQEFISKDTNSDYILRSDSTCEDGVGKSYAGLFESIILDYDNSLLDSKNKIQTRLELAKSYSKAGLFMTNNLEQRILDRHFEPTEDDWSTLIALYANKVNDEKNLQNSNMNFILHKYFDTEPIYMCLHPNIEDLLIVESKKFKSDLWESKFTVNKEFYGFDEQDMLRDLFDEQLELVGKYKHLISKLDDSVVWVMESNFDLDLNSNKIFQIRPYLKKNNLKHNFSNCSFFNVDSKELTLNLQRNKNYFHYGTANCIDSIPLNSYKGKFSVLVNNSQVISYGGNNVLEHDVQIAQEVCDLFLTFGYSGQLPNYEDFTLNGENLENYGSYDY